MRTSDGIFGKAGAWAPLWLAGALTAQAALPGAWETFSTRTNAEAWLVYDFAYDDYFLPEWDGGSAGLEYIWSSHAGDEPLSFFTDDLAGNGALVGDYAAANVKSVSCDIYIEDLDEFEALDCAIFADGPAGKRLYYSEAYYKEDFSGSGWWNVEFSFSRPWYYYQDGQAVAVSVDEAFLGSVETLEFTFYPREGSTANAFSAIDEVKLEPKVEAPELTTAATAAEFSLSFQKAPGISYALEQMDTTPPFSWSAVPGQTGIGGPGTHVFTTPVDRKVELFRVTAGPLYTPVVTE